VKLADKIAKEKARLEKKASERGTFEKQDWFKPETGENLIRLLPHMEEEDEIPFVQVKIHYIGKELEDGRVVQIPVRCLDDFDKECPVCKAHFKALKAKDKELAQKLRPQERYLYNVLDYKNRKVTPWAAGVTVHQMIMEHAGDLENPFTLQGGRDWKLVKKVDPRKRPPTNVTYTIRPTPKDSDVASKHEPLLDEAVDLETLYSTEELTAMKEFLSSIDVDSDEGDDEGEDPPPKKSKFKSKSRDEDEEEDEDEDDVEEDDAEEEDEDEEEDLKAKAKAKAKAAAAKAKAKSRDEDEDEEEEEDPPPKKSKSKARDEEDEDEEDEEEDPPPKKKGKKKSRDEDDLDIEDEDLEKELRDLGVE
jgi:hypothetical protein